jgi:hypothetical protein
MGITDRRLVDAWQKTSMNPRVHTFWYGQVAFTGRSCTFPIATSSCRRFRHINSSSTNRPFVLRCLFSVI